MTRTHAYRVERGPQRTGTTWHVPLGNVAQTLGNLGTGRASPGLSWWQLAQWPLGTTAPETGLHTGVWVHTGVGVPNRGYIRVFENAQAFGSPTGATRRCLESQPGLHMGVWIPSRGYTQVFGVQAGATHGCLESQKGDCASCHFAQSAWFGPTIGMLKYKSSASWRTPGSSSKVITEANF